MFIADLLIVSLWALFAWHFAWGQIITPVMIGLRLALCLMLYRKSRWTLVNAVVFAVMYIGMIFNMPSYAPVYVPIVKIAYVGCCLFGYSDPAIRIFNCQDWLPNVTPLYVLWVAYSLWLTAVPVVCSWKFKSILPVIRFHRGMIWYVGAVAAMSVYMLFTDKDASIFVGGFFLSLTPLVYRCIYRKGRLSLIQSILRDRILMIFASIATVLFSAVLIGLYEVNSAKPFASFLFPIILYVVALKTFHIKAVRTAPALLLGVAGFLNMSVHDRWHETVIILLGVSGFLSFVGVALFYRQCRSIFSAFLLLAACVVVLPFSLLGYNPYAAIDANDVVSLKSRHLCPRSGLYEFLQYGSVGLRDRYGIVLFPNYKEYEFLDSNDNYIALYIYSRDWQEYALKQIYDLKHRRNILPDDTDDLYRIEKIRDKVYAIYNHEGEQVYTLRLPRTSNGIYEHEIQLIDCCNGNGEGVQLPSDLSDMTVTESDDGKLVLYTYDNGCGGTSPGYSTYIQYESGDSVRTDLLYPLTESDYICASDIRNDGVDMCEGSFTTVLSRIPLSEKESGYIIEAYNKASGVEGHKEAILVRFVDGKLKKTPFEKKGGEIRNSLGRDYYIPDWYFTTDGLGMDRVLSFDKETNTLYMPEDDDIMVLSDRYDLYRFKNGKMRYVRNDAGYWLHPSLHEFHYLAGIYRTESKLIRIDAMIDHTFRYSQWPKSKPMSSEPELVLHGGKAGIVENAIVFRNGDYTYIVPEYRRGQGDDFGKVIVKYKDKVIRETGV